MHNPRSEAGMEEAEKLLTLNFRSFPQHGNVVLSFFVGSRNPLRSFPGKLPGIFSGGILYPPPETYVYYQNKAQSGSWFGNGQNVGSMEPVFFAARLQDASYMATYSREIFNGSPHIPLPVMYGKYLPT